MNEGPGTKNTEARHVWFVPAPGFLGPRRDPFECACGRDVVEHGRILKRVVPVRFGERGIVEHAVHALGDAVVLRCVWFRHLVLNPFILQVRSHCLRHTRPLYRYGGP